MTLIEKLETLNKPGTVIFTRRDFIAEKFGLLDFHEKLETLKDRGHAIVVDETYDCCNQSVSIRVFHYLSCNSLDCKKEPHGKV